MKVWKRASPPFEVKWGTKGGIEAPDQNLQNDYALIGEFIVAFEEVVTVIRETIHKILARYGLGDEDMIMATTTGLTADPLISLYRTLAHRDITLSETTKDDQQTMHLVLKVIVTRLRDLVELRNVVAHSSWEMGGPSFDPDHHIPTLGLIYKHGGEGLVGRRAPYASEFPSTIAFFRETKKIVQDFQRSLAYPNAQGLRVRVVNEKGRKRLLKPKYQQ